MRRIAAVVVVAALSSCTSSPTPQSAEQLPLGARVGGQFHGWVWVSTDRPGCRDCSVMVPPGDPLYRAATVPDPCDLEGEDMQGWSGAQITVAMRKCAEITGYTEDPVDHAVGMIACRTRLRDTARLLVGADHLFRFTSTALDVMFTDTRERGDVATYAGAALEVQDADGSWVGASYECDFDHGAGRIIDVRTE